MDEAITAKTGAESGEILESVATIWTAICGRSLRTAVRICRESSSCFSAGAALTALAALAGISMAGSSLMVDTTSLAIAGTVPMRRAATRSEKRLLLNIVIPYFPIQLLKVNDDG